MIDQKETSLQPAPAAGAEIPAGGRLFRAPFECTGRIGRLEYALSCVICVAANWGLRLAAAYLLFLTSLSSMGQFQVRSGFFMLYGFALFWFFTAQAVKRCHDRGISGWWKLIPFFGLWLLVVPGNEERTAAREAARCRRIGRRKLFRTPFSCEGRIRRLEYGLSCLLVLAVIIVAGFQLSAFLWSLAPSGAEWAALSPVVSWMWQWLLSVPPVVGYFTAFWLLFAQGIKRCHDLGHNGWWQLIPFYGFWLLFAGGEKAENAYGGSPKGNDL